MLSIILIIILLLFPIIVGIASVSAEVFGLSAFVSLFLFIAISVSTVKPLPSEIIPQRDYTVETTPSRHYIYVKNENRIVINTMIIDKVEEYNLINSGKYQIVLGHKKNFFMEYTDGYTVKPIE